MRHWRVWLLAGLAVAGLPAIADDPQNDTDNEAVEAPDASAPQGRYKLVTTDGNCYPDSVVLAITPAAVDIRYTDTEGDLKLATIPLADLSQYWRERFGFDGAKAETFAENVTKNQGAELQSFAVGAVNAGAAGPSADQVQDWCYAIYAQRAGVRASVNSTTSRGSVIQVEHEFYGSGLTSGPIFLDGVNIGNSQLFWLGVIYPTGLQYRVNGTELPVYCVGVKRAYQLGRQYASLYRSYYAAHPQEAAALSPAPEDSDPSVPASPPASYILTNSPEAQEDNSGAGQDYYLNQYGEEPVNWYYRNAVPVPLSFWSNGHYYHYNFPRPPASPWVHPQFHPWTSPMPSFSSGRGGMSHR